LKRSVDGISAKIKQPLVVSKRRDLSQKTKKSRSRNWIWLLILLPIFLAVSFWGMKTASAKLDLFKMFSQGKYLVLFQNNAEMRPSGGFIGSFAIVEFSNYQIKKIDFNSNIYKLDKAYTADHIVPPPVPLDETTGGRWAMRDANFAVSFPEAAEKVEWFYNQETGESVDGVFVLNASVLKDYLQMTGPVTLTDPNTTISADNIFTELTQQIEKEYYTNAENQQINEPKSILKNMMPEILKRAQGQNKIELGKFLLNQIETKQILFYVNNTNIEEAILAKNWGGKVQDFKGDYLQINVANIDGAKSSLNVAQKVDYQVENQQGLLFGDLTVTRTHGGTGIWPDGKNRSWIKVLVPQGSILKQATLDGLDLMNKMEKGEEAGRDYFATWVSVAPSTSTVLHLNYLLPLAQDNYQLLVQKQSGSLGDELKAIFEDRVLYNDVLRKDTVIK